MASRPPGRAPWALLWWYEHLLSMEVDLEPELFTKLGDLAAHAVGDDALPAPLSARLLLRALRRGPAAAPLVGAEMEEALAAMGDLVLLSDALANELPAHIDLRRVRPPPG